MQKKNYWFQCNGFKYENKSGNVSCTHMFHVHTCFMYTHVSCTHMFHVHTCFMYTHVSCTHMFHVHTCFMYTLQFCDFGNFVTLVLINPSWYYTLLPSPLRRTQQFCPKGDKHLFPLTRTYN